jgi:hypothetical protein
MELFWKGMFYYVKRKIACLEMIFLKEVLLCSMGLIRCPNLEKWYTENWIEEEFVYK